ncbi:4'-phosphopantetheinyl transferase superfamily protein [Nostoc sp. FACHB-152]|uniref:4'-phosphopantetheinyl transferase HetI n=1 Tax=unclassified Nostoc TaxID=2593658 RepID=UPI00168370AA|nr:MULTISPECIES: 4'-phosphopantetheinyl transferase HetI [unclassified Nostoc]MBD2449316.1 4'-phosphopantetheinyl transferase superfamily protein [Nostoc sp. FACHB-152]MBD2470516.1 4'-phosphopantetheinyl transferase superfamily protein [Nostoc sp. FACHB-145]
MTGLNHLWLPVPKDLTLLPDEVHVWRIDLDVSKSQLENLVVTLSSDELARANRFHFQEHCQRFIAGRGSLRNILSLYLGITPQQVQFDYEPRGKPLLADPLADSDLLFNLSHSQGLALCAVNYTRKIGIDLEYIRSVSDVEALAQRFFLPREYEVVRSLPPDQQQQVFFRYWTCKEAYLKATGDGISQLEQVEIALTPTQPAKLLISEDWSLVEFTPADNYRAAVAVAGSGWNLKCLEYAN